MAKRRSNGEGTIRKRSDGRWEARYYDPRDDKQHSLYAPTQTRVKDKLKEALKDIDISKGLARSDMTVAEWLDIWLSRYAKNIKPLTMASYTTQCNNHIKPNIGESLLLRLNVDTIQIMYNTLFEGTIEKPGLSAKTIKNIHGVLHKALEQAVTNRYIPVNPADGCVLPKVRKKEIKPLSEKDVEKFMVIAKKDKYSTIFLLTLFTGMRQSEVLGLRWGDIDFDNGTITISRQLQKEKGKDANYFIGTLKNDKTRIIIPAPYVMNLLRQQKIEQDECKNNLGDAWVGDALSNDFVFTHKNGRHLVHHTVYKHYKTIVRQIGIEESRFHDLRHSYAVLALQNGDDVKTVQETLGHHTSAFTLDVYGHVSKKMQFNSANRMEAFIQSLDNDNIV